MILFAGSSHAGRPFSYWSTFAHPMARFVKCAEAKIDVVFTVRLYRKAGALYASSCGAKWLQWDGTAKFGTENYCPVLST